MVLKWLPRFKNFGASETRNVGKPARPETPSYGALHSEGIFPNATGFVFQNPVMFDMQNPQVYNTVHNTILHGPTALERLFPYTCPGAAVDSSARHPPPRCHANTRQRTLSILQNWVNDPHRCWKAIWLRGYAGTGKSAVAQTFGESCIEKHRLGAAYFFSRTNGRNDQKTVIPTIAYQLSLHLVGYRALLASYIANDPAIFEKTPRTQFRHLIVEPLSMLQMSDQSFFKEPLVIILDGLDECKGIDEQCDLVEMIGEVVRLKTDLPLLWLITSRPELHLKSLFSRAEFAIACGREILVIDAETRDDVERFLRDGFDGIRARYPYVTDASWPSLEQVGEVAYISSGLFVLASTIIKYIGDPSCGNPMRRLENFLAFVENAKFTATDSPLQSLDLLYSQILSDIPTDVLPTTKRIINAFIQSPGYLSVQALCNFLSLAKHEFYHALTGLHSLFDIPPPEEAAQASLKMYHASFTDYIVNSSRSGRFCVDARDGIIEWTKLAFTWYQKIMDMSGVTDHSFEDVVTADAILPNLTWSSPETELGVSRAIKRAVVSGCWYSCVIVSPKTAPGGLLAQIKHFNFGCMRLERGLHLYHFFRWLFETDLQDNFARATPRSQLDAILLENMMMEVDKSTKPVAFPLASFDTVHYLFVGHGIRTCLFWFEGYILGGRCRLRCKMIPRDTYSLSDCIIHKIDRC